jgi:hypothetical protein
VCQIRRVPLVAVWSLARSQKAPEFSGVIDPVEFCGVLQVYCCEHQLACETDEKGYAVCLMAPKDLHIRPVERL